ncbi:MULTISPECIES: hypothetical protein [Nocardioides]|uniref:Uncharacterized protein n=1 Tax=Nocardioides vastitatis TaxID=2568655 RepID=A0ABW0ZLB1_9ACTN|nr:hypothetical protein [Nocardioides sp.]THJ07466.1 hypothetical protein E7Z54_05390 [Nocardioides sp.]
MRRVSKLRIWSRAAHGLAALVVLIRDGINEDLRITRAREELVQRLESRFTLRGAVVSGSGPLEVIVAPAQ